MKKWQLILLILGATGFTVFAFTKIGGAKVKEKMVDFLKTYIKEKNPTLPEKIREKVAEGLVEWSSKRGLDVFSVASITQRESTFDPRLSGDTVSRGLMMLTRMALDQLVKIGYITDYDWNRLFEVDYNLSLGTLYYLYCVRLAEGNRREAIARYRKTSDPSHPTAQSYADDVLRIREQMVEEYQSF